MVGVAGRAYNDCACHGGHSRHGSLLIVSNHLNLADPPILGASIYRKALFMAKEELFRSGFSSYIVRNFGAFPVRRGGLDRKALNQAKAFICFTLGQMILTSSFLLMKRAAARHQS